MNIPEVINKLVILKLYPDRFWHVADLDIMIDGRLDERIEINRFYKVTEDWFYIYDTEGGQGTGYQPGEIIRKIYIGDAEFKHQK